MRTVPVSGGHLALVDNDDFEMVSWWKWSMNGRGYPRAWSVGGLRRGFCVKMHRLILLPSPWESVDHINGDPLDNRRSNLRVATQSENSCNQQLRSDNSSGYKGVSWSPHNSKWTAHIVKDYRAFNLGYFPNANAAALAYDAAAREMHGEFARVNFAVAV